MMLKRTAKSCRSDAPMPASSLREAAQATVSNKPGHRGEREVSRKTIARGMPGRSGVTVVTTLVCFFISHARLRVHRAPGIPCALYFRRGETVLQNSGASRREIAESYLLWLFENRIGKRRAIILSASSRTSERSERDPGPITTNVHVAQSWGHSAVYN